MKIASKYSWIGQTVSLSIIVVYVLENTPMYLDSKGTSKRQKSTRLRDERNTRHALRLRIPVCRMTKQNKLEIKPKTNRNPLMYFLVKL